ncbi:hypothetical protein B5E67_13810 [Faecalibacterium sp. An122]|nr:hypothetical protein B5E67_13810 [Faecalibacterium sp. An122]
MPGAPHREERVPLNGWYKALEDRIWLTQLGLNILLPLVLCLGGCWWAGLDFNRGPARCAGPLRRKNPKKPRRGFVAHDFHRKKV